MKILRVHSAIVYPDNWVSLFTSEPYSKTKYVYEQLDGRVGIACFQNPPPYFFGITPDFIKLSAYGRFENNIVVMMGCDGLRYPSMAETFIRKGAKAYISWDKGILAYHADKATIHLLQHLTIKKQTVKSAVEESMKEVGPDPESEGILQYYPDSAEECSVPKRAENSALNIAEISLQKPFRLIPHVLIHAKKSFVRPLHIK